MGNVIGNKICTSCKKEKSEFAFTWRTKTKRSDECKACINEKVRRRRGIVPGASNATNREYYKTHSEYREKICAKGKQYRKENPSKLMFWRTKSRAKARGIPFSLEQGHVVIPQTCPCCGVVLKISDKKLGPCSPSLDRLLPHVGYLPSNVWIICQRCNVIKNDASVYEIRRVADAVEARLRAMEAEHEAA